MNFSPWEVARLGPGGPAGEAHIVVDIGDMDADHGARFLLAVVDEGIAVGDPSQIHIQVGLGFPAERDHHIFDDQLLVRRGGAIPISPS